MTESNCHMKPMRIEELADGLLSHMIAEKVELNRSNRSRKLVAEYLAEIVKQAEDEVRSKQGQALS